VLGDAVPDAAVLAVTLCGFGLLVVGIALHLMPGAPRVEPREVAPPVRGRWSALNSPAGKVPSHGTHGYGQSFAVDLLFEPADGGRPRFGAGPGFRPPSDFPGFGEPLYAPDAGTVVAVRDGAATTAAAPAGRPSATSWSRACSASSAAPGGWSATT